MRIATWNLLHRIHAVNWSEQAVARYKLEPVRIAAITLRVARLDADAICLQEVSGDQLAALRGKLPIAAQIVTMPYPRVPALRDGGRSPLADPTEHLVTVIARAPAAAIVEAAAFDDDPGKGFLAVDLPGLRLINLHVTHGEAGAGQLARVGAVARAAPGAAVICGDFNADRAAVEAALGPGFALAPLPPGAPPTRPRSDGRASTIDHLAAWRAEPLDAAVTDVSGESDHNLVTAGLRTP